ncbi:MAG: SMP-30/gluconolactonase/LRE family protein [Verrucomicrobiota bacterium]|nr:SMP-30/gluconolactonase/LRE family protein [Verrucomicrobiota bacterium]
MKTQLRPLCLLIAVAVAWPSGAEAADLVAPGANPVKLAGGFKFTEGPAVAANGDVYFTDIPNNRIHKWAVSEKKLSIFAEESNGANGLYFADDGSLYACQGNAKRVVAYTPDGSDTSSLAKRYDGKKFNKPNDLWIDAKGGVYFSDPNYGNKELSQDGMHVYYIQPGGGDVVRVADGFKTPNGLIGTPDGSMLYIADIGDGKIYRYAIQEDGTLKDRKLFCESGSDGMTLDQHGNVYLTAGSVKVFSPMGEQIADLKFPERPANVVFGGKELKTLYVTARTGFYSLDMAVTGAKREKPFRITISTIEDKMLYDIKEFNVETGKSVILTFKNKDFPPHNLLIVKPGKADEVANLAIALGNDGFGKQWRPDTPMILWGSTMIDYDEEAVISFTAPPPGDYPYVCTFPGHAMMMRGVMKVTPKAEKKK